MENKPFKVSLSVDGLEVSDEVLDNHLAIIEVYVCHDGNNAHNLPIKLETIKEAQESLKNKPLVAGFDGFDFEGHEVDEVLIGYFPESSNMRYVEKNGKTYLVAEAIMPKLYAKWAYEIFQRDKNKSVSMEIEVLEYEEIDKDLTEIQKFIFNAVTVLGATHMPACEGASATMIKFSKENAEEIYEKHLTSQNIKKKYFDVDIPVESDETTYMEKDIKINNDKDAAIESKSWSNPGESLYGPLLEATNKKSLVKEAYLIVEDGYEDAPSEHLKYPHHSLKGSELVLNVKGVIAAFQRASQEGIVSGSVKEHLLRHYRELGLSTENFEINEEGGKSMPEEEKIEEKAEVEEVIEKEEIVNKEEIYDEKIKEAAFDSEKEDEKSDRDDAKEEAKKEEEDERSEIDDYKEEEKGEEMEADSEEEEPEKDFDEKEARIKELEEENCALKERLCRYEEEDKARMVEASLAKVFELMSQEEISNLREEAKNYSLEEMSAFDNKVKAAAFEKIAEAKEGENPSYTKMAITDSVEKKTNGLW